VVEMNDFSIQKQRAFKTFIHVTIYFNEYSTR